MRLKDGYTDIPPGKIATVVTHLEMLAPAVQRASAYSSDVSIRRVAAPDVDWYRDLYWRIGAIDWLWFSRLMLETSELDAIVRHPDVEVYALTFEDRDEGLLELDFRKESECELAFFGVTTQVIGRGAGRLMMNKAIEYAWSRPIRRFWVHTCTMDHPHALPFYIRSGFVPFHRQIEVVDDPRLTGLIPETAAPHVPIIRP